jgi:hypothetical protein
MIGTCPLNAITSISSADIFIPNCFAGSHKENNALCKSSSESHKSTWSSAEYERVTQKVLTPLESILQNAKQLQHACLSWHVRCPSRFNFPASVLQHLRCNCFDCSSFSVQNTTSLLKLL